MLDVLLGIPALGDSDVRDARVEDLRRSLRRPMEIERFDDPKRDLQSILAACLACSGGLKTFTQIVLRHHRGDESTKAAALARDFGGPTLLSTPDREVLRRLLAGIPIGDIADAVADVAALAKLDEMRSLQTWRDIGKAIRLMERLPVGSDGVPTLLVFVGRLNSIVVGPTTGELGAWLETVSGGLGISENTVAELRSTLGPGSASVSPEPEPSTPAKSAVPRQPQRSRRADETGLIWGGVPIRNRNFTGRDNMLERLGEALRNTSKASVLPQTLHGMGGVGKTQLVVEYVYRHIDQYDLIWWIAAEQPSSVLRSLTALAERLGLATTEDRQQNARIVLDALAGGGLTWLLVYDNADDPDTLDQFLPSSGGDVIVTSRIQEWAAVGPAIEVDVFRRDESVELLRKRTRDSEGNARIQEPDARALAEKLGDLPLALEQAAAWYLATAMPIKEYIELLDTHIELLAEGKPINYPVSVAAFVTLAMEQLRRDSPATAQLFELFAYLGGEPVAVSLLINGKDADVTEPLRGMLRAKVQLNRAVRDLNRFGLAKVDAAQRIQVHRLVQRVLRDTMPGPLSEAALRNVRNILVQASPGDPDENPNMENHADLGPHIDTADLTNADSLDARAVVGDYARYLFIIGDYAGSQRLAERAVRIWEKETFDPKLGPDGEMTLLARAQLANARRATGDSAGAAPLALDTYNRLRDSPLLGADHEYTLITGNQLGSDLRIAGKYAEALAFDQASVDAHRRVFGAEDDTYTLRAKLNLAVDYRMIGDFAEAFRLDQEVAQYWEDAGRMDRRSLEALMNMGRSYYGMGAYAAGVKIMEDWLEALHTVVGSNHRLALLADRTFAILLRKAGRLEESVALLRDTEQRTRSRFGANHEYTVAAAVSLGNAYREAGRLEEAQALISDALGRYKSDFGDSHPLTLVATVNDAIVKRAAGELDEARELDERNYARLSEVLSPEHPYTLCAGSSVATNLALAGDHAGAVAQSTLILQASRATSGGGDPARDGFEHPYVLMRAINLAHDLRASGSTAEGDALFAESFDALRRFLGPEHHEVVAISKGRRAEGDIESPPT
ncbi:FxSxx-COOH system tetratricopeptide repeat protein [Asanoa sp. NPDC050611]|uniref:FxSxx-COOH system tetratricopeptide repeat protein n=1 Tax=Asanoa sp. NPDC050611 TaxID=3157098 RepID=UPI0033E36134